MPISLVHISIRTPKFMKANIIHIFTKLHTTFCMSNDDKKIQIFVRQMMRTVVPNILKYDKNISCVEAVAKKALNSGDIKNKMNIVVYLFRYSTISFAKL